MVNIKLRYLLHLAAACKQNQAVRIGHSIEDSPCNLLDRDHHIAFCFWVIVVGGHLLVATHMVAMTGKGLNQQVVLLGVLVRFLHELFHNSFIVG